MGPYFLSAVWEQLLEANGTSINKDLYWLDNLALLA